MRSTGAHQSIDQSASSRRRVFSGCTKSGCGWSVASLSEKSERPASTGTTTVREEVKRHHQRSATGSSKKETVGSWFRGWRGKRTFSPRTKRSTTSSGASEDASTDTSPGATAARGSSTGLVLMRKPTRFACSSQRSHCSTGSGSGSIGCPGEAEPSGARASTRSMGSTVSPPSAAGAPAHPPRIGGYPLSTQECARSGPGSGGGLFPAGIWLVRHRPGRPEGQEDEEPEEHEDGELEVGDPRERSEGRQHEGRVEQDAQGRGPGRVGPGQGEIGEQQPGGGEHDEVVHVLVRVHERRREEEGREARREREPGAPRAVGEGQHRQRARGPGAPRRRC